MHVHRYHCFGARPGEGNPALVIEDDDLAPAARQAFAAERHATCVFLGRDNVADYYYPHQRSPLCLHATLALAALLLGRAPGPVAVRTALRDQRLELSREGGDYFVRLAPQPAPAVALSTERVGQLLGAPGLALARPPAVASVGSPKLLAEVADAATLHALRPDLAGIAAWSRAHGVNGIYVYCQLDELHFEGRNFNHLDPALEDSATGVAAGALALALAPGQSRYLRQGRATGRDCLIKARREGAAVLVGGAAEAA